jgi:hypothetical protein
VRFEFASPSAFLPNLLVQRSRGKVAPREEARVIGQNNRSFIMELSHGFHVPASDNKALQKHDRISRFIATAIVAIETCMSM